MTSNPFVLFHRTLRSWSRRLSICAASLSCSQRRESERHKMYDAMSEIPISLFQLSVSLVALAAKANQDGILQQQIDTMGLRQWLSLVSAWLVERAYSEVAALQDFRRAVSRMAPITAFIRSASRASSGVRVWQKKAVSLKSRHEIEFNLLNRYLIVPVTLQFIFDCDGKHVPHRTRRSRHNLELR
jgi:hypothetical protein